MRPPSFIARALVRLAVAGLASLAAVGAGGRILEHQRFGADTAAARERVALAVVVRPGSARPARTARRRRRVDASTLQLAAQHEPQAERRLFDELSPPGRPPAARWRRRCTAPPAPVAWTGRPVELPDARITGPEAAFLVPDAQGLRLVHVHPLSDPGGTVPRVGTLVLQAPLARAVPVTGAASTRCRRRWFRCASARGYEGGVESAPDEFSIRSANGETLATVSVSTESLDSARNSFRARVAAVMLGVVVVLLLLATGPLLDWRRLSRQQGIALGITATFAAILLASRASRGWHRLGRRARQRRPRLAELAAVDAAASVLRLSPALPGVQPAGWRARGGGELALDLWRLARRAVARASFQPRPGGRLSAGHVGAGLAASALVDRLWRLHSPRGRQRAGRHPALRPAALGLGAAGDAHRRRRAKRGRRRTRGGGLSPGAVALGMGRSGLGPRGDAVAWLLGPLVLVGTGWSSRSTPMAGVAGGDRHRGHRLAHRPRSRRLAKRVTGGAAAGAGAGPGAALAGVLRLAGGRRRTRAPHAGRDAVSRQRCWISGAPCRHAWPRRSRTSIASPASTISSAPPIPIPQGAPPVDAAFLVWSQTELVAAAPHLEHRALQRRRRAGQPLRAEAAGHGRRAGGRRGRLRLGDLRGGVAVLRRRAAAAARRPRCCAAPSRRPRRRVGSVVVHVMLDYSNLPFLSAQSPYVALLRAGRTVAGPAATDAVAFAVYGWSGGALHLGSRGLAARRSRVRASGASAASRSGPRSTTRTRRSMCTS